MSDPARKSEYISVESYYHIESTAEGRSDYYDGEMFAMAGGTTAHARIGTNLTIALGNALKGKSCEPFNQDQRIKSEETGLRIYPDASVFCEPLIYDDEDPQNHTAINPTALFEVLAESTEAYDRGFKFECFRKCSPLSVYMLIAQDRPHVEMFVRNGDGVWQLIDVTGIDQSIEIPVIDVKLQLSDLYERVEFTK